MKNQEFIDNVSLIMLLVAGAHLMNAYLCYQWGDMARRRWVKTSFYASGTLILLLSFGRIITFFIWPENLGLKVLFGVAGGVMVFIATSIFTLATKVMQQRVRAGMPAVKQECRPQAAATLAVVIEELEAKGRRHGWL